MDLDKVRELLRNLQNLKILVVGDLILDRYLYGKVERISPEAPVPILEVEREEIRLGGAGNVANNLSALGVKTYILGVIGKDTAGERIRELLLEKGIEALLIEEDRPTTQKTRVVSMSQQLLRIDRESRKAVDNSSVKELEMALKGIDFDGVIVSDYAKGVVTEELIRVIKENSPFISIDPRPVNRELYVGADLITPNEKELMAMMGDRKGSIEELGRLLKGELSLGTLVVTRGAMGMSLFREGEVKLFPARARKVYDVTGAGDTVIAVLTSLILAGADWDTACELSNIAAGIVVGEFGTATATPEQILGEIGEER